MFSILGYFYIKSWGKEKLARKFIPRQKEETADFMRIVEEEENQNIN